MEELKNFIKVWILAAMCLSYCYYIASKIPKGLLRLLSILPIFYIFILLPFNLRSFHLLGPTCFFLIWLANFKLFLFSFDQPPLSPLPPNLLQFIFLACLPIKLKQNPSSKHSSIPQKSSQNPILPTPIIFAIKALLVVLLVHCYSYKHLFHPYVIKAFYCLHMYMELEIILAISAFPAKALFGFEIEPQFNEPYLSTSLQDFWGHRWNLMVTSILRPTVYLPVRHCVSRVIGPQWASSPAIFATFVVSGLMHEIIYFYLTRLAATWEVTWFFVLHGVCVAIEVAVKKVVRDRWQLNRSISRLLTVFFLGVTGFWLFFPQLIRNNVDEQVIRELTISVNFVEQKFMSCLSFVY